MKIGMLIIGNEILDGKITDLNTKFLSEFLRQNHLELSLTVTVKDTEASIHLGLKTLFEACDVVVTSGGLGPTLDDVTKETIASFMGRKILFSEDAMRVAENNYARFNRPYPGREHGYSTLPEGFVPLNNSTGFAPGFFAEFKGKFLLSAPGVPREFKVMMEDHFLNLTGVKKNNREFLGSLNFRTKKVPEEKIFGEVDKDLWKKLSEFGDVSSLPILYGVDVGIKLRAPSSVELEKKKTSVLQIMQHSPVWEHVWHVGTESIEELVVLTAKKKNLRFGFAESCTGGLCSHRITNVSGASSVFMGSVVSYDNSVKEKFLGVHTKTLEEFGAVSVETACEMAKGLREKMNLDIAVSITGIAGPQGGSVAKPVGTVCIGVATIHRSEAVKLQFFGDREVLKLRFSQAALFTMLEELEKFAEV